MFIELAVEANANYIVSGNTNDFTFKEFRGISILTPKEFYEEWQILQSKYFL
jgi:predicted nucleic acid-binding protein